MGVHKTDLFVDARGDAARSKKNQAKILLLTDVAGFEPPGPSGGRARLVPKGSAANAPPVFRRTTDAC